MIFCFGWWTLCMLRKEDLNRGNFRVRGDTVDINCLTWIWNSHPLFGDQIEQIDEIEI
ncbi:MAG: hypothetical protein IPG21_03910 [Saprospiraceae bacterium]|nr:hypothetical protein [Candidatus Vicinibacter affinis]